MMSRRSIPSRSRRVSRRPTFCEIIMDSTPQSQPKSQSRTHDTGFPEPFCGTGNTTRRHPDAKISNEACIWAQDIDVEQAHLRARRTFLTKYKNTLSYGKLTPGDIGGFTMYGEDMPAPVPSPTHTDLSSSSASFRGRPSKDGADGFVRGSSAHSDNFGPFEGQHGETGSAQKSHFLQKLRLHR